MTDTTMHFLACFGITVVAFALEFYNRRRKRYKFYSKTTNKIFLRSDIIQSVILAMTWSLVVGFGKEVIDIFRSDPQIKDLIADTGGALFAGVIIWLIGMKYIAWRFKHE